LSTPVQLQQGRRIVVANPQGRHECRRWWRPAPRDRREGV